MTSERIDIEISDKVSPNVVKKINEIASSSREAHSYVERLKAELASINTSALQKLTSASNSRTAALAKETTAQARLMDAQSRATVNAQKAALTTQKLATEAQRTAAANSNAAAAASRAQQAALRLSQAQQRAAASANTNARDAQRLRDAMYPLERAQRDYRDALMQTERLYRANAIGEREYADAKAYHLAQMQRSKAAFANYNGGLMATRDSSRLARHSLVNLGYQMNDVVVSIASGQAPLTVLIQQGSQIAGIAASAGVSLGRLALAAVRMVSRFIPMVAVVGTGLIALKNFNNELSDSAGLRSYAQNLGATKDQIKKLNLETVTYGDTFKGLWRTIDESTGAGSFFDDLKRKATDALDTTIELTKLAGASIAALFSAAYDTTIQVWSKLPTGLQKFFVDAVNLGIGALDRLINNSLTGIRFLIDQLNKIPSIDIEQVGQITLGKIDFQPAKDNGKALADTFVDSYVSNLEANQSTINQFVKRVGENSVAAAKDRIKTALEEANKGKKDKEAEKRAKALERVNNALDDQIAQLRTVNEVSLQKQMFDKINNKLIRDGIQLTQQETSAIKGKIATIVEMQRAQEMNKINRDLEQELLLLKQIGPQREIVQRYLEIENRLKDKNIQLTAKEQFQLYERLETLQREKGIQQQLDQIYNNTAGAQQQLANAVTATNRAYERGMINAEQYTQRLVQLSIEAANLRLKMGQGSVDDVITSSVGRLVENYEGPLQGLSDSFGDLFTSINDGFADSIGRAIMYSEDLSASLKEVARSALSELIGSLIKLGVQYTVMSVLGNTLMASTAAATAGVAGATAAAWAPAAAMASLATLGANAAPASASIASTMALTQGLATAGKIGGMAGFEQGGYTGNGKRDEIAGVVHGREFVVNAQATARNRETLEAMNRGARSVNTNSNIIAPASKEPKITIENYGTDIQIDRVSRDEVRIIARQEAQSTVRTEAPKHIASEMDNPNSRVSRSMSRNTNAQRRRS